MPTLAFRRPALAAAIALAICTGPALAAPAEPLASRIDAVIGTGPKDAAAAVPANLPNAALWGPLGRLGGTFWYDRNDANLKQYQWKIPGEQLILTETTLDGQRQTTIHLNAFGDGLVFNNGQDNVPIAVPKRDIIVQPAGATSRLVSRYVGERRIMQVQELRNGQWVEVGTPREMVRLSRAQGEAVRTMLEQERVAQQTQRIEQQEAQVHADEQVFGVLARAVGTWHGADGAVFMVRKQAQAKSYSATWYGPGGATSTYTVTPQGGKLNGSRITSAGESDEANEVLLLDEGAILFTFGWLDSVTDRGFLLRDGKLELSEGSADGHKLVATGQKFFSGTRMSEAETTAFFNQRAVTERARAQARAQAAAAAAKEEDSDSGLNLLGTLAAVSGGLAAVAANGGNASQAVGAVMTGMAMANPDNAMAGTLAQQGQGLVTGNGAASTLAAGRAGAGSYPTRPNMLAPSTCPGFTEANYRQKALAGGPDTQLATMCGQAFEYYTMYKRAIAQGYAEADANRTYSAHAQSAQVANNFARTAR